MFAKLGFPKRFWLVFLWSFWDGLTWRLRRYLGHVYGCCLRKMNLELLACIRQCLLRTFCLRFFSFLCSHSLHTTIASLHTGKLLIKIPSNLRFQFFSNLHRMFKFRMPIGCCISLFNVWYLFFICIKGIWLTYRILSTGLLSLYCTDDYILCIISDVLKLLFVSWSTNKFFSSLLSQLLTASQQPVEVLCNRL